MKKIYIFLAVIAIVLSSCENKERLEELKATINLKKSKENKDPKVSLDIPSATVAVENSYDSYDDSDYADFDNDFYGDDTDYDSDYDSEYEDSY